MKDVKLLEYWSPPDGAGMPVGCLATSFTFEADFFTQDCLSRFLSLSTLTSEGEGSESIAAILEEEERLSEAQVCVLIDRNTPAEKRNLRWDLLPVSVPGGLLHAKVAVLIWEHSARVIVGSANLTQAGYRRQIEIGVALDLNADSAVPRNVFEEFVAELRSLVAAAPGPETAAKARAVAIIDLFEQRVNEVGPSSQHQADLLLKVASTQKGAKPLDGLADVWRGAQPKWATVVSPFWDSGPNPTAVEAIRSYLTGRPASDRWTRLVVGVDPYTGTIRAPVSLPSTGDIEIAAFDSPGSEPRTLHAKLFLFESDTWTAAMIGSSNATAAGLGLQPRPHRELNLWFGCPTGSKTARQLRSLVCAGDALDLADERCEQLPDEDEPTTPLLPDGFETCIVALRPHPLVRLTLIPKDLPPSWEVRLPTGEVLTSSRAWTTAGAPTVVEVGLPTPTYPAYVDVFWHESAEKMQATWTANVEDRGALPPATELSALPVDVLLAALASSRPLPVALERELRRRERTPSTAGRVELDPLHRFDDSGLLLQRARRYSVALWELQARLARPVSGPDALQWRLNGAVGPTALSEGIVRSFEAGEMPAAEAQFLIAELALTVAAVDWTSSVRNVERSHLRALLRTTVALLRHCAEQVDGEIDSSLAQYVESAFAKASR